MNFKKLLTTTLLTSAILGSGSIASAASLDSKGEVLPLANNSQTHSIFTTNGKAHINKSVVYVGGKLAGHGANDDYKKSAVFTLANSTGTVYKGWQESQKAYGVPHLQYELVDAATNRPVSTQTYYGDVRQNDGRYWLELRFNNVVTTKNYYLVVTNLGKYPVDFAGNVYN
ncbi:hypothetical protein MOD48_15035 [Bacillus spizizenii]|uniref:Uncharacterized protein n=1 Tax=Bacillus vallismortis TaxID=72361 RepID=A0AAP3CG80_BACVA|nr:hypothetical protein [Bacillus vallismortis]MCY8315798.1 hypothetical protein [Bacillus vallismortis]MCY8692656.1 hypothetical protein [Bacillus spizizenii]